MLLSYYGIQFYFARNSETMISADLINYIGSTVIFTDPTNDVIVFDNSASQWRTFETTLSSVTPRQPQNKCHKDVIETKDMCIYASNKAKDIFFRVIVVLCHYVKDNKAVWILNMSDTTKHVSGVEFEVYLQYKGYLTTHK